MNKHTNVGTHVYKYTCMHISTCKHICEYTHIYKELCIYIYPQICIYKYRCKCTTYRQTLEISIKAKTSACISMWHSNHHQSNSATTYVCSFLSIQKVPPNLVETNKEDIHKCHFFYVMIFYFYLVCFTFSILYSMIPFNLVYVFQFIHLLCYFLFFFKPLSNLVEKLLHIYVYINNMHNIF